MKFFEDIVEQVCKQKQTVCGDFFLCERTLESTEFVLCDGIGSGVYANIAAISCANRLLELFRKGVSMSSACEMVADSMHRARTEEIPFSAFSAAKILNDGQFIVYTYEAPAPFFMQNGSVQPLRPRFYTASYEVLGESSGTLDIGDALLLCSDGLTQAGLGNGYLFGIGAEGIAEYMEHRMVQGSRSKDLPHDLIKLSAKISGGFYADDTTAAVLQCREATQLTVMSGPPSVKTKDSAYAKRFLRAVGKRVICGSTTADVISRALNREVRLVSSGTSLGTPPEYIMAGADMVTEGAIILNQVYNILEEDPQQFQANSVVERLCALLQQADMITFVIGTAVNDAHEALLFKQLGIRPRKQMVKLITQKLRVMGKLIVEEYY